MNPRSPLRRALVIGLVGLLGGCAAGSAPPPRPGSASGVSDGVAWEVRDVVKNSTRGGWNYTLILTERAGIPIQFEREEFGVFVDGTVVRSPTGGPFQRRLGSHETLHFQFWISVSPISGGTNVMVWRRYIGKDTAGRSVTVDVRFYPRRLEGATVPAPPAAPPTVISPGTPSPIADRLKELDSLRQQRLITEDEYQATRKRILEGL